MHRKKILLVEDDIDDQHLFHDFLKDRTDIEILPSVENGVELFESLNAIADLQHLPDLIILDQNMPKMNGKQTLQLLKSTPVFSHIPIVVYSTYTDEQLITECTLLGATIVASKPVSQEGYHKMINNFLKVAIA